MNDLAGHLLEASSDAIMVLRAHDEVIVEASQALAELTGRPRSELVGSSSRGLTVRLGPADRAGALLGPLERGATVGDLPVAVRTGPGGLLAARLSGLGFDVAGQGHALCVLRDAKVPTQSERRLAIHAEVGRILQHGSLPEVAPQVLAVIGACLGWDAAAFWEVDREAGALRCAGFWSAPTSGVRALEAASRRARFRAGVGLLGRAWAAARPAWTSDVDDGTEYHRVPAAARDRIRGWFAWPVMAGDKVAGMVELFSREPRPADADLLELTAELGRRLGGARGGAEPALPPASDDPPPPGEDTVGAGELNHLVERVGPVSLTLKGVSERTGIPAATVRTWERRYGFIHPDRTASGYRLYQEDDIVRILMVKRLLQQGVRIGQAADAVGQEAS
jgi:hypothetical protein